MASDDTRLIDANNTCSYTTNRSDVVICTRWYGTKQTVHYAFIGDRVPIEELSILETIENGNKITDIEDERIKSLLKIPYEKYMPIRFVRRTIFEDDTRITVLEKIVRFIQEYYRNNTSRFSNDEMASPLNTRIEKRKDLPITWAYKKAWLFNTDPSWVEWKANPWKLQDVRDLDSLLSRLTRAPNHTASTDELVIDKNGIQISYIEDIPLIRESELLKRWYTLWNDETPISTWEQINMVEYTLREIWNYPSVHKAPVKVESCNLDEFIESGVCTFKNSFMEIFDTLPLNHTVPFIQWIGDRYHIVYRLFKKHRLSEELLNKLTDVTKTVGDKSLKIVLIIPKTSAYIRFVFDDTNKYYIHAKLTGNIVSMKDVHTHIKDYKTSLQRLYGFRFKTDDRSIRGKSVLQLQKPIKASVLFQELTKYGWLFSVQEGDARYQRLKLSFLRSSSALHRMNEEEFIRSQLLFIDNREELLEKIQQVFGVTITRAKTMLENYEQSGTTIVTTDSATKEKKWVHIPATVFISKIGDNTILVQSENFPNLEDMYRMIHWIQGIIAKLLVTLQTESGIQSVSVKNIPSEAVKIERKAVEIPKDIFVAPSPVVSSDKSERSIRRSASSSLKFSPPLQSSKSVSTTTSSSSSGRSMSSTLGGGVSGTGYDIIGKLKNADAVLFTKTQIPNSDSKYPRLCSANTNQQPIVLTHDEMKAIDESEYKNSYDNKMLYGSDKDIKKHHYYMCPRIWCPTSKIPLTPEQLEKLGGKCPAPHQEEPWLLYNADYWGRDPSKKHFIGFHKKQGTNGLCLPCCKRLEKVKMDKDPMWDKCIRHVKKDTKDVHEIKEGEKVKEKEVSIEKIDQEEKKEVLSEAVPKKRGRKAKQHDDKEDYYLLRYNAPIDSKRWGIIPEKLHTILQPNKPYTQCYTQIKSDSQCLIRKGIYHYNDSLLNAIGYILSSGKEGKRGFLKKLELILTPLSFISLENGSLLASLLDTEAIIPSNHQRLILDWKEWVQKYPDYVSSFGIRDIVTKCAYPLDMSTQNQLKLSRELMIYTAWKRFWEYMESTEVKDLMLVYDLIKLMGVRLLVWEKISEEEVYLRCPLPTSWDDVYTTLYDDRTPYMMLMFENEHYEPIELKSRGADGITLLDDIALIDRLKQMYSTCSPIQDTSQKVYIDRYVLLRTLPTVAFDDISTFEIQSIFITPKLTIGGFILKSGIHVYVKNIPIHHIHYLMKIVGTNHIVYEEDLKPKQFTFSVPTSYLTIYMKLLEQLQLSWSVISVRSNDNIQGTHILNVEIKPRLTMATIPTNTMNTIEDRKIMIENDQHHWITLQRVIGKKILANYSRWIEPNLKKPFNEQIDHLVGKFSYIPYVKKVRTILEEIPYDNKEAITSWIQRIGTANKYPFYSDRVQTHRKKEWIFSQLAIGGSLPNKVVNPPKVSNIPDMSIDKVVSVIRTKSVHPKTDVIPPFLKGSSLKSLPTKWITLKQFQLDSLKIASFGEEYKPMEFWKWLQWISETLHVPVPFEIVQYIHQTKVAKMISNEEDDLIEQYISDPAIWRGIAKRMNLDKSKSITVIKKYLQLEKEEQWTIWKDYYTSDEMMPCDLDIWIYSQLINIAIVMLHKSPSGTGVDISERNKIEDFLTSITLFYDVKYNSSRKKLDELPLIPIYKISKSDSSFTRYEMLIYKNQQYMFNHVKDAPKTVSLLVHEVAKLQKVTKK